MAISSREIARKIAPVIGPGVTHVQPQKDRLHMTGIEIAIFVGTGALLSFASGFFEAVKEGLQKQGKRLGEATVEECAKRIAVLADRSKRVNRVDNSALTSEIKEIETDLDALLNAPDVADAMVETADDTCIEEREILAIGVYLTYAGFPADEVQDRAVELTRHIRLHIQRDSSNV